MEKKLEVLKKIAAAFNKAELNWALGASAMLYFRRKVDLFHDLDLMIDTKDAYEAEKILSSMGKELPSQKSEQYRSDFFHQFIIDGVEIDLIAGFRIIKDGIEYDCSFHMSDIDGFSVVEEESIPLQSLAVWKRYYELMGREAKAELCK